jgi:serine/threonine protein kinase
VLGAFYVERSLGVGGVGSVFVVTRVEDRHDPAAERFALKVPDYNENAARHLSESQFLAHFRAEASALMALPPHPSLARFVSFDLGARPKPILVMELVEGPNLERLVETQGLDVPRALQALTEVLDGLSAMHEAGVGHLDLKPANVVLRDGTTAVLVDFGLAGRNLRPGCGSAPYSPPEVWGAAPADAKPTPMAADVYAFACLAFELLTGELLMEGETEIALVSAHLAHDGMPPRLRGFARDPRLQEIGELLFSALRRLPQARISITDLKSEWSKRTQRLAKTPIAWPVPLG